MSRWTILALVVCLVATTAVASAASNGNPGIDAALKGDWATVQEEVVRWPDTDAPQRGLLLGYAAMAQNDCSTAWKQFSAIDKDARTKSALLTWSSALAEAYPHAAMGLVFKSDALARLGQYQEATVLLDRAVKLDAKLALAYDLRGLVKIMVGDGPGAAADLEKASELAPLVVNARYERGILHILAGDFTKAVVSFDSLLEEYPRFFLARNARGVAHLLSAHYDLAMQDFDQVETDAAYFLAAKTNKQLTGVLRAKGLFAVDMEKLALSPKGILGSSGTTQLYYVSVGINSKEGGDALRLAKQMAGPDAVIVTIRENDLRAKGITPNSAELKKEVSVSVALGAQEAMNKGKNVIVVGIGKVEDYGVKGLVGDYMVGGSRWKSSREFMSSVADTTRSSFQSVCNNAAATLVAHSFGVDVAASVKSSWNDVIAIKGRTGGALDGAFANNARRIVAEGGRVSVITGKGDIPSLNNLATTKTADRLTTIGGVRHIHDMVDHGHGIPEGGSVFSVRTKDGAASVSADLATLLRTDGVRQIPKSEARSGVFLRLGGSPNTDVTATRTADLAFVRGDTATEDNATPVTGEDPELLYPFLIFTPPEDVPATAAGTR